MAEFEPTEKVSQMLTQKSPTLALESAELRLTEYNLTGNSDLASLWEQVRDLLKAKVDADAQIIAAAEEEKLNELKAIGDASYANFCKLKKIKL